MPHGEREPIPQLQTLHSDKPLPWEILATSSSEPESTSDLHERSSHAVLTLRCSSSMANTPTTGPNASGRKLHRQPMCAASTEVNRIETSVSRKPSPSCRARAVPT